MRTTYRVLAYLLAVEVMVQAAAIAYAIFGLGKYIDDGAVVDKATQESESPSRVSSVSSSPESTARW